MNFDALSAFNFIKSKTGRDLPPVVGIKLYPEKYNGFTFTEEMLNPMASYLDLSFSKLKKLPDNLTVNGHFNISENPIEKLPNGLHVDWDLDIKGSGISFVGHNIYIGGDFVIDQTDLESDLGDEFESETGKDPYDSFDEFAEFVKEYLLSSYNMQIDGDIQSLYF